MTTSRPRSVVLLHRDSNNMASSWTVWLVLQRRRQGGGLEIVQKLRDYDLGGTALEYVATVEGPDWLADFITEPPGRVADRFCSFDTDEFLSAVAQLNSRLAVQTRTLLKLRECEALEPGEARPFLGELPAVVEAATGADGALRSSRGAPKPLRLSEAILKAMQLATSHHEWSSNGVDWTEVFDEALPLEMLASSGFRVTPLFRCAADGMASGVWLLSRVDIGGRGYLVFDLPDDEQYQGGALLVGWEPASSSAGYRAALEWAYGEYGQALSFPFTRSDIEVEMVRNEGLFRKVAARAIGGTPPKSGEDAEG